MVNGEQWAVALVISGVAFVVFLAVTSLVEEARPAPDPSCPIVGSVELPWSRGSWDLHLECRQCEGQPWVCGR